MLREYSKAKKVTFLKENNDNIAGVDKKEANDDLNRTVFKSSLREFTFAVVIPTKNRLTDLLRALEGLKHQTRRPDEIVIVDQSDSDKAREIIKNLLGDFPDISLKYIFNRDISGLTAAKNLAVKLAKSDILLFIDDDIILDRKFMEVLHHVYSKHFELSGVGGIIMLPGNKTSLLRRKLAILFQIGPFRDLRAVIQAGYLNNREIVPSWLLSGGLSSLKKEVFQKVSFNEDLHGASPIEDLDFYLKASEKFKFAIALEARALHNISQISRFGLRRSFEQKFLGFWYIFSKYIIKTPFNIFAFVWRSVGMMIDAVVVTITRRTLEPITGLLSGIRKILVKFV